MDKKKGFVTIATGKIKYHKMAYILMQSYRLTSDSPLPFAIITDKENKYTKFFDDVIIEKNVTGSYMDKIDLLIKSPYEETIFIDADCIAFNDLNKYWSIFKIKDDFSCFGNTYSLDSDKGFFDRSSLGVYLEDVKTILDLHGGIYYIKKGQVCQKMYKDSKNIIKNYSKYNFKKFNYPADEPVLALAMAINGCLPISATANDFAWKKRCSDVHADFFKKKLSYIFEGRYGDEGLLMHFGTSRTIMPLYILESQKVKFMAQKNRAWNYFEKVVYSIICYLKSFMLCILFAWKRIVKQFKI